METIRAKFERNNSLDLQNLKNNEKININLEKKHSLDSDNLNINKSNGLEEPTKTTNEKIPEIKDIYDCIYGNVQSKLEFYESQRDRIRPESKCKSRTLLNEDSDDCAVEDAEETSLEVPNSPKEFLTENENSPTISSVDLLSKSSFERLVDETIAEDKSDQNHSEILDSTSKGEFLTSPTCADSCFLVKENKETPVSPDLLKTSVSTCMNCQKRDFINDRTDVLTEINTNIKLELENVKRELKNEIAKNNELNYEIANMESALETYYKDAKNQKSTLASIYATMKNYGSGHKDEFERSYTYKRIKMIADYVESLKSKLEHQDRIIKNNFVENPYYMDTIIKHEAALQQLDEVSQENQELKENIKKKATEELEIIKELNRQKFQIENKCKEIEYRYKDEIASKEASVLGLEREHKKQMEEMQILLKQKEEEMTKIQKIYEAKVNNYKQELVIVYRKWKEQRKVNNKIDNQFKSWNK